MSKETSKIRPPPLKRRRISSSTSISTSQIEPPPPPPLSVPDEPAQNESRLNIYSWNINGIKPFLSPETPAITNYFTSTSTTLKNQDHYSPSSTFTLRQYLRRWQWPLIIGLQEVKIAASDVKTQAAVRRSVNNPLDDEVDDEHPTRPNYDVHFCLPTDKHNATSFNGKIYGVSLLVKPCRSTIEKNIRTVTWDLEGRILICELPRLHLCVMCVYAVNGTHYDYHDPATGKVIGTRHDRKKEFHTLLAKEVREYEVKGWHVVVAGDMNDGRGHVRNRADFETKFMVELGMWDTFRAMHGEQVKKYTYRPTGRPWGSGGDRVDLILTTKGLKGKVIAADILDTEADRGPSDHVPLFIELNLNR